MTEEIIECKCLGIKIVSSGDLAKGIETQVQIRRQGEKFSTKPTTDVKLGRSGSRVGTKTGAKKQTLVVEQAPYSPDIRRYRQESLNQVRCFNSSFSLQWKSDESTKHYLTHMLLAIK